MTVPDSEMKISYNCLSCIEIPDQILMNVDSVLLLKIKVKGLSGTNMQPNI